MQVRSGVSPIATAAAIVVVAIIVGAGGYYVGSVSTSAVTSTTTFSTTRSATITSTLTQVSTATVALQTQADSAQKECSALQVCLTVYTTTAVTAWQNNLGPAFYAQYPWAKGKINFLNFTTPALGPAGVAMFTKALSEYKSGGVQGDVVWTNPVYGLYSLISGGAIQNYTSPLVQQMGYAKDGYDASGAWVVTDVTNSVLTYNSKVLAANNLPVPSSWTDLGNPIYKGMIAMGPSTPPSSNDDLFYYLYGQMGNASWTQLMQGIAANKPVLVAGAGPDLVAGNHALNPGGFYTGYLTNHAQLPDAFFYKVLSPSVYVPRTISLLKNGPHPQMARLFEDWLISASGQTTLAADYVGYPAAGAFPGAPYQSSIAVAFGVAPAGVTYVNAFTDPSILQNPQAWSAIFTRFFGG